MNSDSPWFIVAILVISFISWIFNRIQEATAERQRAAELKRRREEQARQPAASRADAPPPLPATRQPPQPEPAGTSKELLRDLVEALGGPPTQEPAADRPAARPTSGTRAKANAQAQAQNKPKEIAGRLSAAERAALERVKSKGSAPMAAPKVAKQKSSAAGGEIRRLLSSSRGLRQAIILKEVLDAPVSMRDQGSFRS